MIVDVLDGLRSVPNTPANGQGEERYDHTFLLLDKQFQRFPWESLPCLEDRSISRIFSLACIKDRIPRAMQVDALPIHADDSKGFVAASDNGAYILNPAGDLRKTQETLEGPLRSLKTWQGTIQQIPKESDIESHLRERDILLYFGHGSGSQYIRPRVIKKLTRCATTLLMGCSSGVLTVTGDFEPYGTPVNYMHAGSPALLATLWDVTDKDIDRYSIDVLQQWGLIEVESSSPFRPSKDKGKRKGKEKQPKEALSLGGDHLSLTEAAARSRKSCFLRYLNGAAPVIYGVPVWLDH